MTYPEVQTLLEGITVGGHKLSDEQQILNQNESVNLLLEMVKKDEFELNKFTILKLHEKVAFKEALSWREFRSGNVRIGGTEYLPPKSNELDKVFDDASILSSLQYLAEYCHQQNKHLLGLGWL